MSLRQRVGKGYIYSTLVSKIYTLGFGVGGEGGGDDDAILQRPLKNLIHYHLQLNI
jgi:hypothetical protein